MTKTNHTPEPWKASQDDDLVTNDWFIEGTELVAICGYEANARRIVAAVNACKGFTTEELERIAANKGDPQAMLKLVEDHLKEKGNP